MKRSMMTNRAVEAVLEPVRMDPVAKRPFSALLRLEMRDSRFVLIARKIAYGFTGLATIGFICWIFFRSI